MYEIKHLSQYNRKSFLLKTTTLFKSFFYICYYFNQIFNSRFRRLTRLFMNNINNFQILRFNEIEKMFVLLKKFKRKKKEKRKKV